MARRRPEKVAILLDAAPFVQYDQPESFRFEGDQMPTLTDRLRAGQPVAIPAISSTDVDVALARRWRELWHVGDNVLPLAFRNVGNGIDAMLNLLLDQATRACLGRRAVGWQSAQVQLGLDDNMLDQRQADVVAPSSKSVAGHSGAEVLDLLRDAALSLGAAGVQTGYHETVSQSGSRKSRCYGDDSAVVTSLPV